MSALRLPASIAGWSEAAAALVNTRPRPANPSEQLVTLADLQGVLAKVPEKPPRFAKADLAALRDVRARLVKAFEASALEDVSRAVNPLLRGGDWEMRPNAVGEWDLGPAGRQDPAGWFGARAARALAELTMGYGVDRLHICNADDCQHGVVDVSRNGTRLFCSRTCANRTNTRRHRKHL